MLAHFLLRRADALGFDDKFEEAEEEEIESEYDKPSALLLPASPSPLGWLVPTLTGHRVCVDCRYEKQRNERLERKKKGKRS